MAIHPQSCESAMSNLELFTVPSTHISTEASRYVEHKPVSTLEGVICISKLKPTRVNI